MVECLLSTVAESEVALHRTRGLSCLHYQRVNVCAKFRQTRSLDPRAQRVHLLVQVVNGSQTLY